MKRHIPNILTAFRILLIPLIIYSFYAESRIPNIISAFLFMVASITDFFDGYLAREMQVQSNFGKCLDPIADKLLVITSLVMIVNFSNQDLWILIPSLVIICREVMVSGLREFLATINVSLPVSRLGKWKTGIQMLSIGALLVGGNGYDYVYNEFMDYIEIEDIVRVNMYDYIEILGKIGITISAILTTLSGYIYMKKGAENF